MFKKSLASNEAEYLALLPEDRKETIVVLDKLIKKTVPSLKPNFASNMLGYGSFKYSNYKNQIIDWPVVSLANQKNYISIYICSVIDGTYLAEKYADKLGNVSVGKSCIRFKKIQDVNLETLKKVLKLASKNAGLDGLNQSK